MTKYTREFKLKVVKEYLQGNMSYRCLFKNIKSLLRVTLRDEEQNNIVLMVSQPLQKLPKKNSFTVKNLKKVRYNYT